MGFTEVYDYVPGKAAWMGMDLPFEGDLGPETRAGAIADRDVPTCGLDDKVGDVADRLEAAGHPLCIVVEDGYVMGLLAHEALSDRTKTAAEAMAPGPSTFRPPVPKEELAHYMDHHDLDRTLITTLDGRLVGVVHREALD